MSSAKLTLIGLYSFDNTLFDNLLLPEGINKDTLIDTILLRGGEFETLYPDPVFMKYSIGAWSRKWNATMTRWINALSIEYNPLENYNRMEDWADSEAGSDAELAKHESAEAGATIGNGSGSTSGKTNTTAKHKISADDAGDNLTMRDQDETSAGDSTSTTSNSSEQTSNTSNTDITRNGQHATQGEHHGVVHGNIGVTTSQQMLLSELDLGYWNLYEKLTDMFLTEFVLPVY